MAWASGQLPNTAANTTAFRSTWFDNSLSAGQQPTPGNLTDYYYQMSLGQHIVLGDYYPQVITVSCTAGNQVEAAVNIINTKTIASGNFATTHGRTLADFDLWQEDGRGIAKTNAPNGKIDAIAFIWRNRNTNYGSCSGGDAIMSGQAGNDIIKQDASTDYLTSIGGSFRSCAGETEIFKNEYFHGLFGSNNWHSGEGAGAHSFLDFPSNYSMTSYSPGGTLACGYDRDRLGWRGWNDYNKTNRKSELISATEPDTGNEAMSDMDIQTFSDGATFILRDFVATGDVIRIKLPHIDWQANGDVKNQYLWLENHQKISSWDKHGFDSNCSIWSKGMYAYLQVGKDIKTAATVSQLFGSAAENPNGLGSWLMPLSAEGNYDYKYRPALAGSGSSSTPCVWGNKYLPKDKSHTDTRPNPLTGMSDLFEIVDYNQDGKLRNGDAYQPWTAEILNGQLLFTGYAAGDEKDAFRLTGNKSISISTNPSPVSLYTYKSNGYNANSGKASYENRIIHLNGLSIEILEENVDGNGAIKVEVKWDEWNIENDVRWCGNIVLQNDTDDPQGRASSLKVVSGNTATLDRGLSPTQHIAGTDGYFTDPTKFTIRPGASLAIEPNAAIVVKGKSEMVIEGDAILWPYSNLTVKAGSILRFATGCRVFIWGEILIEPGAKLIIEEGVDLQIINGPTEAGTLNIQGTLELKDNAELTNNSDSEGKIRIHTDAEIIAGTNASINLSSVSGTATVLEIYRTTGSGSYLTIPAELDEFRIEDAKFTLTASTSLSIECPLYLNNVEANTSYTPAFSGLLLYGQNSVYINGSVFNKVGISVQSFNGGYPLILRNSVIKNCYTGMEVYGGAYLKLNTVNFEDNRVGLHLFSDENTTIEKGIFTNNITAIRQQMGSGTTLTIDEVTITGNGSVPNSTVGIASYGNTTLLVKCSNIHNVNTGIFVSGGTLNLSSSLGAGYNDLSDNLYTIYASNAWRLYLHEGYNNLATIPGSRPCNRFNPCPQIIFGTLCTPTVVCYFSRNCDSPPNEPIPGCTICTISTTLDANSNKWHMNDNQPPIPTEYNLKTCNTYGNSGKKITIIDNTPAEPENCQDYETGGGTENPNLLQCIKCREINTKDFINKKVNEATKIAADKTNDINTPAQAAKAIDLFRQILTYPLPGKSPDEMRFTDMAYMKMLETLRLKHALDSTLYGNQEMLTIEAAQVMAIQDQRIAEAKKRGNYRKLINTYLDKIQVLRMINKRQEALKVLSEAYPKAFSEEKPYLEKLQCLINAEEMVLTQAIPKEEFRDYIVNCQLNDLSNQNNNSLKTITLNKENVRANQETGNPLAGHPVTIYPNPVNEVLNIEGGDNYAITIQNTLGKIVYEDTFAQKLQVNTSAFNKGVYFIKLTSSAGDVFREKIILQ